MARLFYSWSVSALLALAPLDDLPAEEASPVVDEALAVYRAATGDECADGSFCVYRPPSFPEITFVECQYRMTDSDCVWRGAVLDGRWLPEAAADELAPLVLPRHGWDTAAGAVREALALSWVTEVVLLGRTVASADDMMPPRDDPAIAPPAARTGTSGAVEVTGWAVHLTVAGELATRFAIRLAPDGTTRL